MIILFNKSNKIGNQLLHIFIVTYIYCYTYLLSHIFNINFSMAKDIYPLVEIYNNLQKKKKNSRTTNFSSSFSDKKDS